MFREFFFLEIAGRRITLSPRIWKEEMLSIKEAAWGKTTICCEAFSLDTLGYFLLYCILKKGFLA
jgi:hypothetical protein